MTKARNIANLASDGSALADGTINYTDITGTPAPFDPDTLAAVAVSGAYADVTGTPAAALPLTGGTLSGTLSTPALNIGGTQVISNARALTNVASIDATTAASFAAGGVGGSLWKVGANTFTTSTYTWNSSGDTGLIDISTILTGVPTSAKAYLIYAQLFTNLSTNYFLPQSSDYLYVGTSAGSTQSVTGGIHGTGGYVFESRKYWWGAVGIGQQTDAPAFHTDGARTAGIPYQIGGMTPLYVQNGGTSTGLGYCLTQASGTQGSSQTYNYTTVNYVAWRRTNWTLSGGNPNATYYKFHCAYIE